jgi:hypothetical protein
VIKDAIALRLAHALALLKGVADFLLHPSRRGLLWALAVVVVLSFPVTMLFIGKVDDNPDFGPGAVAVGKSKGVAALAGLVNREIDINKWHANDPLFMPGGWLRDMPAFQLGVVGTSARILAAMVGDKGAALLGGNPDPDLHNAAGLLKYPGTVWKFDTRTSWLPTASAERQYRAAHRAIERYNDHVAAGTAPFERTPQTLAVLVEAVIRDLDDCTSAIDHHLAAAHPVLLDFAVNGVFFQNKGRLYAQSIILRELGRDYEKLLADRRLAEPWSKLVDQLATSARLRPWAVWSAAPDSSFLPNHLAAQGYATLRARMMAAELLAALNISKP